MRIIHTISDCGFQAKNMEDLKKQIVEYYTYKGYTPQITIEDDWIIQVSQVKISA